MRFCKLVCFLLVAVYAAPAAAQEMISTGGAQPYDRARLSGFVWHGDVAGSVSTPGLAGIPGFDAELDIEEDLGLTGGGTGFFIDASVGLAARHRIVGSLSGLGNSGDGEFQVYDLDILAYRTFLAATSASVRDYNIGYEYIFSRRDWLEAGAIVGIGYFDAQLDVTLRQPPEIPIFPGPVVATVDQSFASAYPLLGVGTFFDGDVIGVYVELSGFPSVEVGTQSGWVMNIDIDFAVYPTPNLGIIAGYKRYQLNLEQGDELGINLTWDGFVVGGQYIF